jgi:hypothetical protein
VVQFGVLPYVRELLVAQCGTAGEELLGRVETMLMGCVSRVEA